MGGRGEEGGEEERRVIDGCVDVGWGEAGV